ncbi:TSC22 domain family protein 4-like [Ascaphus truei]|uniref:TSC22 domain family protein 4-like n=1 Tax=Ascaphus truei TaxID=8439 RepID=UPI003F592860
MSLGKKRSGFQITSVTSDYQPPPSPSSPPTDRSLSPPTGPRSPPTSRFRVVRLDQAAVGGGHGYKRGRWSCVDFYQAAGGPQRAGAGHSLDSGLPRAAPQHQDLLLSPGTGGRGHQGPWSQGALVLGGAAETEIRAQLSPPADPSSRPVSPLASPHRDVRPSRDVSDVFTERLILARSVFCMGESDRER